MMINPFLNRNVLNTLNSSTLSLDYIMVIHVNNINVIINNHTK